MPRPKFDGKRSARELNDRQCSPSQNVSIAGTLAIGSPGQTDRFTTLVSIAQCPDFPNVRLISRDLKQPVSPIDPRAARWFYIAIGRTDHDDVVLRIEGEEKNFTVQIFLFSKTKIQLIHRSFLVENAPSRVSECLFKFSWCCATNRVGFHAIPRLVL